MFSNNPCLLSSEDGGNSGLQQYSKNSHWLGDVFDPLCAKVVVTQGELVADLFMHFPGDTDTAGLGETLQPCRDIDPVTVDLIALDHYVAEVDADAEFHTALRWQLRVLSLERGLNIHCVIHRIDHAGELGQNAVAGRVYEAAVVLPD